MKKTALFLAISALGSAPAFAQFTNGGFEAGDASGWTVAGPAYRNSVDNSNLDPAFVTANQSGPAHSAIIAAGTVDPNVGALLGTTVYSGNYSYRVEDVVSGGYASTIAQTVNNYTDPNIFFAWKAVLEGAHTPSNAAIMKLVLRDLTDGVDLITRTYNASTSGGGGGSIFLSSGGNYYTPDWQIEQLAIGAGLSGHDFSLTVLASDCQPTGHFGYVYLDGFGNVTPPPTVPEPASLALLAAGLFGLGAVRRRKAA